jgi:hypothetical protein
VSLMKSNNTVSGAAAVGVRAKDRAKDAAAQALPAGKRAGTTAVQAGTTAAQGVVQGVQGAKEWAAPRLEDAVAGVGEAVQGAREWIAPRLEDAAEAVTATVAPKVSSALRSTASQVRPEKSGKTGIRRLLSWRWLLGLGAVVAAAGAGTAVTMRRRYASATAAANDATTASDGEYPAESGEAGDAPPRSEVNGRITTSGNTSPN